MRLLKIICLSILFAFPGSVIAWLICMQLLIQGPRVEAPLWLLGLLFVIGVAWEMLLRLDGKTASGVETRFYTLFALCAIYSLIFLYRALTG